VMPVLMVVVAGGRGEEMLSSGQGPGLAGGELCPGCGREGVLGRWGSYPRLVRWGAGTSVLRVRRAMCRGCGATHALLPACLYGRRMDLASAIGVALAFAVRGGGFRPVAVVLGVPETTVRSWLRRARERAVGGRALFVGLLAGLGAGSPRPPPAARGGALGWLVDAIVAAHVAARERFGSRVSECVWSFSSAASGGLLLANTDLPSWPGSWA
jgi:hypothetical protein